MNDKLQRPEGNLAERVLVILLRLSGIVLLSALIPAVMPHSWMDQIHRQMDLGQLPDMPIVGYLTRSLSAMYALHGAIVFFVSPDVRRYLPLIRCLFVLGFLFGLGMVVLDRAVNMPTVWACCEGPSIIILSAVALWVTSRVPRSYADLGESLN
jgi:hypothetical protein